MRLCACGCGVPIPVANCNNSTAGYFKGQQTPARFLRGHHLRINHPAWWKGDDVGYRALHTYLSKHFPKTGTCDECGDSSKTEYALIKGRVYSRERTDYRELCKRCHNFYDSIDDALQAGRRRYQERAS